MDLEGTRAALVVHAQRLQADDLATGTSGNLSARVGDRVAITPTGVDYATLEPEMICVVSLEGEPIEATFPPSSELPLHLAIYRACAAEAIVHTHSPYATALSIVLDELPAIHYLVAELGGPVRVAPYATFGTEELAANATLALTGRHAVLLEAHGAVTTGDSVAHAYARSLYLEWLARIYSVALSCGTPRALPLEEIERVGARLDQASYGPARRLALAPTDGYPERLVDLDGRDRGAPGPGP